MLSDRYSDDQLTPWFHGTVLPKYTGLYQVRLKNSTDVIEGYFDGGGWRLDYQGMSSRLPGRSQGIEWRGLSQEAASPKSQRVGFKGFVHDWRSGKMEFF